MGSPAGPSPGVATWDEASATDTVAALRPEVDVIIVSVHGGTEYLPTTDPGMAAIADSLSAAGADVIWGHGAHVVQPVELLDGSRPAVAATSLGNFLFDQAGRDRTSGFLLELLVGADGVIAYRTAETRHPERRVEFVEWLTPVGNAVWIDGSWWTVARTVATRGPTAVAVDDGFRFGAITAGATGDVTGDGSTDLVVSFRREHRSTPFMELHPEVQWADAEGRSAHVGVYDPEGLTEIWVAGSVLLPVAAVEVCDGSLAIVHDQLDDPTIVSAGAWVWSGFGFDTAPDIPGAGTPACADVDRDGLTEPVILDR